MTATKDERRKRRCIMTTDSDWQRIGERARKAGLPISRFIAQRMMEPAEETAVASGLPRQAVRDMRVLLKIEERRFREEEASEAWDEIVAEAEAEVGAEEAFG